MRLSFVFFGLGLSVATLASAEISFENWPTIAATPPAVRDATRPGYWWWPTTPAANESDRTVWGNRGNVYGIGHKVEVEKAVEQPPAPLPRPWHIIHKRLTLENILFDSGKSIVSTYGKAATDKVVAEMKRYRKDLVTLEGHTDDGGDAAYNVKLGLERAKAVKQYMVEQGIAEARIEIKSYGATLPAVPNISPANRKLNRRVSFGDPLGEP